MTTKDFGTLELKHVDALKNATLDTGASGTQAVTFTIAGNTTYNIGALTGSDALAIGGNTISVGSKSGDTTFSGAISGANGSLTKVGSGTTLTLSAANTYTGTTNINAGILKANIADVASTSGALGNGGNITFTGGKLQYTSNSAGTNYGARVKNSSSAISLDTNGQAVSLSGIDNSNTLGLTLNDSASTKGTLTLSGANSYTGDTTITAGTLNVSGTLTSAISVGGNATLRGEGSTTGNVTFAAGSTFVFDPATTGANQYFRSTGTINTTAGGSTKIKINLASSISSGTSIVVMQGGTLSTNGASDFLLSSRGTLTTNSTQVLFDYTAGNVVWKGGNSTNPTYWDVNTTPQNFTLDGVDDFYFDGDNVTFDDTASSYILAIQGSSVSPGSVTFSNSTDYSFSGGGISGPGSMSKTGSGSVALSNTNTYTGSTTISGGTLNLSGSLGSTAISVGSSGTLTETSAGVIGGSASLTTSGAVTLAGNNTYSGTTTLNAGVLRATTSAGALGAGSLSLAGGELQLANDTGLSFGRNTTISANSQVTSDRLVSGAGVTHTLGTLSIGAQTLSITKGSLVSSGIAGVTFGTTTLTDAAIFDTAANTNLTLGAIGGNFDFTKQGAGTMTLGVNGTRTSGKSYINGGILSISADARLGVAPTSPEAGNIVFNGGTIYLNYGNPQINANRGILINAGGATLTALSGNYGFAGKIEGEGALTVSGPGGTSQYITGNAAHTYSGGTTLSSGTAAVIQSTSNGTGEALSSGPFGVGTLYLSGGSIRASSTVATYLIGNTVSMDADTTVPTGGAAFEIGGAVTLTGNRTLTQSSANNVTISGAIGDAGSGYALTKAGTGTLTLTGSNSYSGGTTIKNGSVILSGGNDRLLTTGSVVLGDTSTSGKLVLGDATTARNQTLAGLTTTGSGGSVVGANATTDSLLTLNIASGTNSFGGTLGGVGTNENKLALTKSGGGTLELSAANTYTGATTIKAGTLTLTSTGTISNSPSIIVGDGGSSGSVLDLSGKSAFTIGNSQTLNGIGTVNIGAGKAITIDGTHSVGNVGTDGGVGTQTVTGDLSYGSTSLFEWDINTGTTTYDKVALSGSLTVDSNAVFKVVSSTAFSDPFWSTTKTWSDIFGGNNLDFDVSKFLYVANGSTISAPSTYGAFTITGSTLTWSAVPSPTSALAGLLIGAGLLRRRRKA